MFPVLDSLRAATGFGGAGQRQVQAERSITVRVDETDEYITLPLRSVFTDDGLTGWSFELGPYSMDREDSLALLESLVTHLAVCRRDRLHPLISIARPCSTGKAGRWDSPTR